eukprot:6208468-Pleurochrysis_carterae.AAC.1
MSKRVFHNKIVDYAPTELSTSETRPVQRKQAATSQSDKQVQRSRFTVSEYLWRILFGTTLYTQEVKRDQLVTPSMNSL